MLMGAHRRTARARSENLGRKCACNNVLGVAGCVSWRVTDVDSASCMMASAARAHADLQARIYDVPPQLHSSALKVRVLPLPHLLMHGDGLNEMSGHSFTSGDCPDDLVNAADPHMHYSSASSYLQRAKDFTGCSHILCVGMASCNIGSYSGRGPQSIVNMCSSFTRQSIRKSRNIAQTWFGSSVKLRLAAGRQLKHLPLS